MFPDSYRNTSGSLGEREIEVGTRSCRASVSTQSSPAKLPRACVSIMYVRESLHVFVHGSHIVIETRLLANKTGSHFQNVIL